MLPAIIRSRWSYDDRCDQDSNGLFSSRFLAGIIFRPWPTLPKPGLLCHLLSSLSLNCRWLDTYLADTNDSPINRFYPRKYESAIRLGNCYLPPVFPFPMSFLHITSHRCNGGTLRSFCWRWTRINTWHAKPSLMNAVKQNGRTQQAWPDLNIFQPRRSIPLSYSSASALEWVIPSLISPRKYSKRLFCLPRLPLPWDHHRSSTTVYWLVGNLVTSSHLVVLLNYTQTYLHASSMPLCPPTVSLQLCWEKTQLSSCTDVFLLSKSSRTRNLTTLRLKKRSGSLIWCSKSRTWARRIMLTSFFKPNFHHSLTFTFATAFTMGRKVTMVGPC